MKDQRDGRGKGLFVHWFIQLIFNESCYVSAPWEVQEIQWWKTCWPRLQDAEFLILQLTIWWCIVINIQPLLLRMEANLGSIIYPLQNTAVSDTWVERQIYQWNTRKKISAVFQQNAIKSLNPNYKSNTCLLQKKWKIHTVSKKGKRSIISSHSY